MKIRYRDIKNADEETYGAKRFYENKFFGLFLNAYKFTGLSRLQERYLLKQLWAKGTIACFIVEGTKPEPSLKNLLSNNSSSTIQIASDEENGLLVFCPYASSNWNIYDEPAVVSLINVRGATFIPTKPMKPHIDCVLGWAHSSHAPIRALVMYFIDKIVEVEEAINMNLFAHKLPRLVVCSPEDKARVEDLIEAIDRGEKKLFLDANDYQAIKNVLDGGAGGYIIDKLYQYKQNLENELLSFLGINNIPVEKKERLITDEANANNQMIGDSSECFLDSLKDFCEEITNVLGYPISVEANSKPMEYIEDDPKESEDMKDDDNI